MTDTTNTLPDDVLERAAEAAYTAIRNKECRDDAPEWQDLPELLRADMAADVAHYLPILTPAIETALLERMIAELSEGDGVTIRTTTEGSDGSFSFEYVTLDSREAIAYLRTYLPAVTP